MRTTAQELRQIVQGRNTHYGNAELLLNFLHCGQFAAAAFHAIQRNQYSGRPAASGLYDFDRFAHGSPCRNDVVDNEYAACERRAHRKTTFAMVLGLLAIETKRKIAS